jgi:hypothetical protein
VKFSFRQILASTAGAVIAAIVASLFGVKGTIVGVAIGSAAATMGTALVAQSIDRGHEAVKQVAVRVPETSTLLRKLGGTGVSGPSATSVDASSSPTEVLGQSGQAAGGHDSEAQTVETASSAAPAAETQRLEISAAADAPATERLTASTTPSAASVRPTVRPGFSWRTIAVGAVTVFVLALLLITAVELISGKPLSAIFGGADTGTTLHNLVNPTPTPATTPTTTTSTTPTSTTPSTTTTTTTAGTTTSSTAPGGSETTTTSPSSSSSSTTTTAGAGAGLASTTTSLPSSH